ncbi:hypothetical protein R1flu_010703 [Riccia fluitans]|uniref:Uncharacterized protein n=1 Tax=Riccia fluitans TaxID=41844 RepID=A0ABD1Z5Q6_9MARC
MHTAVPKLKKLYHLLMEVASVGHLLSSLISHHFSSASTSQSDRAITGQLDLDKAELNAQIETLQSKLSALEDDNDHLQEKISNLQADRDKLEESYSNLEQSLAGVTQRSVELDHEKLDLHSKLETHGSQLSVLQSQLIEHQETVTNLQEERNKLEEESKKLEESLASLVFQLVNESFSNQMTMKPTSVIFQFQFTCGSSSSLLRDRKEGQ